MDEREAASAAGCTARGRETEAKRSASRVMRAVWAAFGFACFTLAVVGVVLPILPTTPFLLVAAFCFARSSRRVDEWFRSTKVYRTVLEGYATKRAMTIKAKLSVLVPVTVLLGIAFACMGGVAIGRLVVAVVWLGHLVYFGFVVKTERPSRELSDA